VPVAASGGLARATAEGTWFRRLLLASGGLRPEDSAARAFFRSLDPMGFLPRQHGVVYMLDGAQDEFFPLDQVLATYRAVRAPEKSLEIVADYDHGWYFGAGCPAACMPARHAAGPQGDAGATGRPPHCPADPICPTACPEGATPPYCGPEASYNRHDDFQARWALLVRTLVSRRAANPPRPATPVPQAPFVQRTRTEVVVRVATEPPARVVRLAISDNEGYTFGQVELSRDSADGAYHYRHAVARTAILIAEVETADGATATSLPVLPRGFRPRVRPFGPPPH
jgi:hypothetical protein